ncbi:MAG: 4a-hydroxytetrahydrobiopterin dehydratase [Candidatus Zixiibacteriota bacterium]
MEDLTKKKCEACEGGVEPLTREQFSNYLEQVSQWSIDDNDKKMERELTFNNFKEALKFVNDVGAIAEEEGHHPNIYMYGWNNVKLILYTHAIGGLSINDFIVATKIDRINIK